MPLTYAVRAGMMGQTVTAPEMSLDTTYEELVGWYRDRGYQRAYYTDGDGNRVDLPLIGLRLSGTKIRDLRGYDPSSSVITIRQDAHLQWPGMH